MKRILITGASGLLGLNMALDIAGQYEVYGVVNSHAPQTDAFHVVQANLLGADAPARLIAETKPDLIVHCAAVANLETAEKQPELAQKLNADVPGQLATEAARHGIRMVHISTDAVFDGVTGCYAETDAPNPLSAYGRTKLAGERAVAAANPDAIIARVNFYGWSLSGRRSLAEFFYNNLAAGNPVKGFTDVYFCPLFVLDLSNTLLKMLDAGLSGLYHVVSPEFLSKFDFGVRLAQQFGLDASLIAPASVNAGGLTAVRSSRLNLRTEKLTRDLGAAPGISAGLDRFYAQCQAGFPQQIQAMQPA
ncbi:MAG: SDR family oxidoreductase [Anaerolineales bacterium]|nr:SDR family oxidoreductase [Anaerolineales bacterium]